MAENQFYKKFRICEAVLQPINMPDILPLLSCLPQINAPHLLSLVTWRTAALRPLCTSVTNARLLQANELLSKYRISEVSPYVPIRLVYGRIRQVVFPPVVLIDESWRNGIILDGMHRVFVALAERITELTVLALRDKTLSLPGDPTCWDAIKIVQEAPNVPSKFLNFRPDAFRVPFTKSLNEEWLWDANGESLGGSSD